MRYSNTVVVIIKKLTKTKARENGEIKSQNLC